MSSVRRRDVLYACAAALSVFVLEGALITTSEAAAPKTIYVHIRHDAFFDDPANHTGPNKPNGRWQYERTAVTGARWGYCDTNQPWLKRQPDKPDQCNWYYDETNLNRTTVDTLAIQTCWNNLACTVVPSGKAYMMYSGTAPYWSKLSNLPIQQWYAEIYSVAAWNHWLSTPVGRPMIGLTGLIASDIYKDVNTACLANMNSGTLAVPSGGWLGIYLGGPLANNGEMRAGTPYMDNFIKALNDCTVGIKGSPSVFTNQCTAGATRCNGLTSEKCGDWNGDGFTEWGQGDYCPNHGATYVCANGSCVNQPSSTPTPTPAPTPTCTNQCTAGTKRCTDGLTSENCGDWNSDGCTEWGRVDYCPNYGSTFVCGASGYCVNQPGCTNQCANGAKSCTGDTSNNCGDWNGDGCTEWGHPDYCPNYGPTIHCNPSNGYCVGS